MRIRESPSRRNGHDLNIRAIAYRGGRVVGRKHRLAIEFDDDGFSSETKGIKESGYGKLHRFEAAGAAINNKGHETALGRVKKRSPVMLATPYKATAPTTAGYCHPK